MKFLVPVLAVLFSVVSAQAKLGAKEGKYAKDLQPKVDKFAAAYKEACGCQPKFDVNWEAVASSTDDASYRENAMDEAPKCIEQLSMAVGSTGKLCSDYKKEVCATISKVNVTFNGKNKTPWTKLDKASKTLTLSVTGGASGCDGNSEMKDVIEKVL